MCTDEEQRFAFACFDGKLSVAKALAALHPINMKEPHFRDYVLYWTFRGKQQKVVQWLADQFDISKSELARYENV